MTRFWRKTAIGSPPAQSTKAGRDHGPAPAFPESHRPAPPLLTGRRTCRTRTAPCR
ncbi:MAG: group-specific protein [Deltaproteobacteria bacterium]|nr:group-specific protein [Deltaproteobacteria bacterium]PWB61995.1 MAG: group-specific protein [Deltaproteobacteria bacterium]